MRKNNQPTPDLASAKLEANRIKQSKRNEILGYINKCDRTIRLCDSECAKAGEIGTDSEDLQYAAIMDRFGELVRRAKSLFTFALHSNTVLDVLNSTYTLYERTWKCNIADVDYYVLCVHDYSRSFNSNKSECWCR